jgi:hypothetical protein
MDKKIKIIHFILFICFNIILSLYNFSTFLYNYFIFYKSFTHVKVKAFPCDYIQPIMFLDTKEPEDGFMKAETLVAPK